MAFTPGKLTGSTPLLEAYSTTKQLKQKDRALDIDEAYKQGLINNDEARILIQENRLAFDERRYDTTESQLDFANIDNIKTTSKINQYNLDQSKLAKELELIKGQATSRLTQDFNLPDTVTAENLFTVDNEGNYQLNPDFTTENLGVQQDINKMRTDLINDLTAEYPDLDQREINKLINDNWESIYGENMNAFYDNTNKFLTQAWQDEYKNADTNKDGEISAEESKALNDKLAKFIGTNPEIRNLLAPGMLAGGMDPNMMMYNIGGQNVNIAGDAANYARMKKLSDEFTWSLEVDDETGATTWKKVPKPKPQAKKEPGGTADDPDYDNFTTVADYSGNDFKLLSNYNYSDLSGNKSFQRLPREKRNEYYKQIKKDYDAWWAKDGWGAGGSIEVRASDGGDTVTFGWGAAFIDQMNRDYTYPIKYKDGRPYATIEGEWGNNDEHTIWLDDTWEKLGYNNISAYIADAVYYKSDSDYSTWEHMGD